MSWQIDGKYLDLWSMVHFLGGSLIAIAIFLLRVNFVVGLCLALTLMILWEIYEDNIVAGEQLSNKIVDVAIGLSGFLMTYKIFGKAKSESSFRLATLTLIFWLSLEVWGNISKFIFK